MFFGDIMEYTNLAGIKVSALCFGSLPLSPLQREVSPEAAGEILAEAFRLGVNFIDTAQFYRNYNQIYAGLRNTNKEIVVASKTYAYDAAGAKEAVEQARHGLDRDMIDIFLLHEQESGHTLRGHQEALEELYRLKSLGVIRAIGISTHHIAAVHAACDFKLDVIHPIINKEGLGIADGNRAEMEAAISKARNLGIGVYSMKALGGGHFYRNAKECFDYALGQADCVAVGMREISEVRANAEYFNTGSLPVDWNPESSVREVWIGEWCRGCGSCAVACGQGALRIENGKALWNKHKCVLCGYCGGHCKELCVKII